jgi:hypothetical protein
MEFRIADTFTESLAQLTGEGQKALKITAQGRDQRRRLGHAQQRHLPAIRQAQGRPYCGKSDQSPGG